MTQSYDPRDDHDPTNDPATLGEVSAEEPDGDGGAVVDEQAQQDG